MYLLLLVGSQIHFIAVMSSAFHEGSVVMNFWDELHFCLFCIHNVCKLYIGLWKLCAVYCKTVDQR